MKACEQCLDIPPRTAVNSDARSGFDCTLTGKAEIVEEKCLSPNLSETNTIWTILELNWEPTKPTSITTLRDVTTYSSVAR